MVNAALRLVENDNEGDEPPPLEKLASSLAPVKGIIHAASVTINEYDNSVSILLLLKKFRQAKGYGGHEVFRVYDPEKEVSERDIADNQAFIADSMKHPMCYAHIKRFLQSLGYQNFHNPYNEFITRRFREHIAEKR